MLVSHSHYVFLMSLRTADTVDFALDQLDTKKKVRAKLGPEIAVRLRFVQSAAQREGDGGAVPRGGKDGYALVASDGDAAALGAVEAEEVEKEGDAEGGSEGATSGVPTATSASVIGSGKREVELTAMAVSSSSGKAATVSPKGGKAATFTSLTSSGKAGLETVVL